MTDDKIDSLNLAAASLRAALNRPDPSEVVIVRPDVDWTDFVGSIISSLIIAFTRGGLICWAATHVSFVPDFGYWESVWIGLLAAWIFHPWSSDYRLWTKAWSKRRAAARDLFKKGA